MSAQQPDGEAVVDRYAGLVYRLAFARTRSRDAAGEVFQEVFLRYVSKRPVFESTEHEKAWFCRVTINCANSYWRNPFRRKTEPLDAAAELAAPEPEAVHLYYYEGYSTPEIAALVGKSESAVRMRLMRARRLLREYLEDEEGGTDRVSR